MQYPITKNNTPQARYPPNIIKEKIVDPMIKNIPAIKRSNHPLPVVLFKKRKLLFIMPKLHKLIQIRIEKRIT